MQCKQARGKPEAVGANRLIKLMESEGWTVMKLGGGKFTVGWPDFYCYHISHGHRWIETKTRTNKLGPGQVKRFQELSEAGDRIYVLHDEKDYDVLFKQDNWRHFVR